MVQNPETAMPAVSLLPATFERVVDSLRAAINALSADTVEPNLGLPVIARETIERVGYVKNFPQLLGTVHTFRGDTTAWACLRGEAVPGGRWHRDQQPTDVVLTPAACYHVYPEFENCSLDAPAIRAVESFCFRHEATREMGRLQSFRMLEFVFLGRPSEALAWRDAWLERVADWLRRGGLDVRVDAANDPFFGPGAKLMGNAQRDRQLKWEIVAEVADGIRQAVASGNYHVEHFGETFGIDAAGAPAHSACMAFGLERLALAVMHAGIAPGW